MGNRILTIKDLSIVFSKLEDTKNNPLIRFIRDQYKNYTLLKKVNLSVNKGEYLGLVGESGSGKSLTIKSLLGLVNINPGIVNGEINYIDENFDYQILQTGNSRRRWIDDMVDYNYLTFNHLKVNNRKIQIPRGIEIKSLNSNIVLFNSRCRNSGIKRNLSSYKFDSNKNSISIQEENFDYAFVVGYSKIPLNNNYNNQIDKNLKKYKIPGAKISVILQDPISFLNPHWSMLRQIKNLNRIHNKIDGNIESILSRVKLNTDSFKNSIPRELSGGQAQRAMIILSSITKPRLLIADEPTTGLDVTLKKIVVEKFKDLRNLINDISMIFISHDLDMVRKTTDRINVMYKGEIIENAKSTNFKSTKKHHPYSEKLIDITKSNFQNVTYSNDFIDNSSEMGCCYYEHCQLIGKDEKCKFIKPPAISITNGKFVDEQDINSDWVKCWEFIR